MLFLNHLKDDEVTAPIMGRVTWWLVSMILVMPVVAGGESYVYNTSDGDVWFDCENSWANITTEDGNLVGNGSDFTATIQEGNHTVSFEEHNNCQFVIPVNGDLPNMRPAPTDSFESLNTQVCSQSEYQSGSCDKYLVSGNVSDGDDDIFAIDVSNGQLVSVMLNAASSAIEIEVHFQNELSEIKLDSEISIPLNTSISETNQMLIPANEDGRILFTVSSPHQGTLWMTSLEIFTTGVHELLTGLGDISGVGNVSYQFGLGEDESILVTSSEDITNGVNLGLKYRYAFTETIFSEWNNISSTGVIAGVDSIIGIELWWDCDCEWESTLIHRTHFDAGWQGDAPGFKPLSAISDNSSYPLIPE